MSSFNCEHCNTAITENTDGMYTTECEHYPRRLTNVAKRSPILALADILAGEHNDTPIAKKVLEIHRRRKQIMTETSNSGHGNSGHGYSSPDHRDSRLTRGGEQMQKKLTCYRCKKKFDGDPAQGNLCEECR